MVSGFRRVVGPETRLQEVDELKGDEKVGRARVDHILKQSFMTKENQETGQ